MITGSEGMFHNQSPGMVLLKAPVCISGFVFTNKAFDSGQEEPRWKLKEQLLPASHCELALQWGRWGLRVTSLGVSGHEAPSEPPSAGKASVQAWGQTRLAPAGPASAEGPAVPQVRRSPFKDQGVGMRARLLAGRRVVSIPISSGCPEEPPWGPLKLSLTPAHPGDEMMTNTLLPLRAMAKESPPTQTAVGGEETGPCLQSRTVLGLGPTCPFASYDIGTSISELGLRKMKHLAQGGRASPPAPNPARRPPAASRAGTFRAVCIKQASGQNWVVPSFSAPRQGGNALFSRF